MEKEGDKKEISLLEIKVRSYPPMRLTKAVFIHYNVKK